MRLLLISNSTNAGEEYLDYPKMEIRKFLGEKKITGPFMDFDTELTASATKNPRTITSGVTINV